MAARRLAISSLLCADDEAPNPLLSSPGARLPSPPPHSRAVLAARSLERDTTGRKDLHPRHVAPNLISNSPERDVVPMSLQPGQLRRHTPSPDSPRPHEQVYVPRVESHTDHSHYVSDRHEALTHNLRSETPLTHDYAGYHDRLQRSQADSSHNQLLTARGADSYYLPSQSPQATSHASARPSSSRSTYSDSPSQAFLLPLSSSPQLQSPSRSPTSVYSLPLPQHRPSHSPVLSSRPGTTSSQHYFQSPAQSHSPYLGSQLYYPLHSSAQSNTGSGPASPSNSMSYASGPQLAPIRTSQPHSASQSHHSPRVADTHHNSRNTSATSLPNILNTPSPTGLSGGGLGGLEALVQAATEERRRLSGEMARESGTRRATSPRLSSSPVLERALPRPDPFAQTHPQARPPSPTLLLSPSEIRRDRGRTVLMGPAVPADMPRTDAEPPMKRRRSSGSFSSSTPPTSVEQFSAPVRNSLEFTSEKSARSPVLQDSQGEPAARTYHSGDVPPRALQITTIPITSRESAGYEDAPGAVHTVEGPQDAMQRFDGAKEGSSRSEESRGQHETPAKKEKKPVSKKDKKQTTHADRSKHDQRRSDNDLRDQDPHEWLLEHYSERSPPRSATEAKKSSASQFTLRPAFPSQFKQEEPPDVRSQVKRISSGTVAVEAKQFRSQTRTPTPLSILEQELDGKRAARLTGAKEEAHESDVSLELDLALGNTPPMPRDSGDNDMDVEDELLSLVDDQPRPTHSSRPKQPSTSHRQDARQRQRQPESGKPVSSSADSASVGLGTTPHDSMPPPASPVKDSGRGSPVKVVDRPEGIASASSQKKKATGQKAVPKPKAPPKPKAKAATKAKAKSVKDTVPSAASPTPGALTPSASASSVRGKKTTPSFGSIATGTKRSASAAVGQSRSRSASIMPAGLGGPDVDAKGPGEEPVDGIEKDGDQDDKLYCVCKTSYDEDRVMIACDRCDEWYHTQCVNMPDLEVDLVDQFICPPCVESNPHLHLRTTYKRRCFAGLKHQNPSSPSACHKPSRGAFSKYCSDECGIQYMQSRIDAWGGAKESLWESVKDANKREGVVVRVKADVDASNQVREELSVLPERTPDLSMEVVRPSRTRVELEAGRLYTRLAKIEKRREELKYEMEVILWREKLIELASARADILDECGWDQRLCFGEEEFAEFGATVIDSYEEGHPQSAKQDGDAMQVDGEWWCRGKRKCERHAGWQKLRSAEIEFEKETREAVLAKLTVQEREIRKQIEELSDPTARTSRPDSSGPPLQPLNGSATPTGPTKVKTHGDVSKKGKKKKS